MNKYPNVSLCLTNRVNGDDARAVNQWVINELADIVFPSAGPRGSTTQVVSTQRLKSGAEIIADTVYTKDGKTIAEGAQFNGQLEASTAKEIVKACDAVDNEVGDGTTSIILLGAEIFNNLCTIDKGYPPYLIIKCVKDIVAKIIEKVKEAAKPLSVEDVYDIAMISTNNNNEMSTIIRDIYKEFGNGVYVEVKESYDANHYVKDYRGLTLNVGVQDTAYINTIKEEDKEKIQQQGAAQNNEEIQGMAIINNARVYAFQDPIDTPEMAGYLDAIVAKNIMNPYNKILQASGPDAYRYFDNPQMAIEEAYADMKPTVIFTRKISLDMECSFNKIATLFHQIPADQRPPLLVVSNIPDHEMETYVDIFTLCGCKPIKKYIDPKMQEMDMKQGLAWLPDEAVDKACGFCEQVKSDREKTVFINPSEAYEKYTEEDAKNNPNVKAGQFKEDENGNFIRGNQYNVLVNMLEGELNVAIAQQADFNTIGGIRRRLNCLKGSLVELYVGGVSTADRNSVKDLVIDAIKNIRSAAKDGVGFGANFEALRAMTEIKATYLTEHDDELSKKVFECIENAYRTVAEKLYGTGYVGDLSGKDKWCRNKVYLSLDLEMPYNLVTEEYDGKVKCSIKQDISILDTLSRILTILFTTNQAFTSSPSFNIYSRPKDAVTTVVGTATTKKAPEQVKIEVK